MGSSVLEYVSLAQAVTILATTYIGYGVSLVIYRLYFNPLSRFPGPKLAAATLWYEFYFDVINRGRFGWEIERMHQIYGPVVRINPFELHINEPDFCDELYTAGARKRNKYAWSAGMFGSEVNMLATIDHELHRRRRAPIAQFFSGQAMRKLDPVIRKKLELLSERFDEYRTSGEPISLEVAFCAMTTDIITEYAFGTSNDLLFAEDFKPDWVEMFKGTSEQTLLTKQFPWLTKAMRKIPLPLLLRMIPAMGSFFQFQNSVDARLDEILSSYNDQKAYSDPSSTTPQTIFHGLLSSDLPASELTKLRLQEEAQTLVGAGAVTTGHYLSTTVYFILADPSVLQILSDELRTVMPNPTIIPSYNTLAALPYLAAVINEGFRLSHGITARLTRVAPDEDLHVAGYTIPAGTPCSMTSWLNHLNPDIFPEPNEFKPERWLEPDGEAKKKYLLNFSKGSRVCLGKELARMEVVYTLAVVVRRWARVDGVEGPGGGREGEGMRLWETSREDVDIVHDWFNPWPRLDSKGVRAVFG